MPFWGAVAAALRRLPAVGKLSMVFDKTHEQGLSKDDEYVVVEGASTLFKQKSDVSTASDQPQGQPKRYE